MSSNPTQVTAPEGQPYIDIVREFDAPPALVHRAHTDASLVERWLGPDGLAIEFDHYDARTGGSYAYTNIDPGGGRYGFRGSFHLVEDELIVQTFEFDGWSGHVSLESMRLIALPGGRTRIENHAVYQSVQDRDGMVDSGMESGLTEGYAKLDGVLAELSD
ncbi:SRPBCC family protein [Paraoerskovia marina]|uniref:Uncharacterized conserved protein YndB, AHSA1/START domain n=1 Tax=Paraoerskovia marina TaxID=545619 RepID=A0A1H1MDP2_9CELL|nr:SRPBCC family protein [Paraoerskovia marina]SDR84826.1 Uncharacterized conserved protein YndB, AHSA1/START domain [Paraoerskovia marina]